MSRSSKRPRCVKSLSAACQLSILAFVGSCAEQPATTLAWSRSAASYVAYAADNSALDPLGPQDPAWAESIELARPNARTPNARATYLRLGTRLRTLALPRWPSAELSVSPHREEDLLVYGLHAAPGPRPEADDVELGTYEVLEMMAGELWVWAEMDRAGGIQSFYLPDKQKGALAHLFTLPGRSVRVGDSWEVPVQLLQLDSRFVGEITDSFSRAILLGLDVVNERRQARILYIARRGVTGTVPPEPDDTPEPFALVADAAAYGVMDVDAGRWLEYTGQLVVTGSGASPARLAQILALRPATAGDTEAGAD